jgi:hypothetical protein
MLLILLFMVPLALADEKAGLEHEILTSDRIVVAEVLELKPSMRFWSGFIPNVQCVRYRVKQTLKGKDLTGEIDVGHYVVSNSYTADKDIPQLAPSLFKKGNQLVLMLRDGRGSGCGCLDRVDENRVFRTLPEVKGRSFMTASENYSVRSLDQTVVDFVRNTLRKEKE